MYNYADHQRINQIIQQSKLDIAGKDNLFYSRFIANASSLHFLYDEIYKSHPKRDDAFDKLIQAIVDGYVQRGKALKKRDIDKQAEGYWYLSNQMAGMSLYVDRFCGDLINLQDKLGYFEELGINLLHLMPIFESPEGESDGGYAVSNFREVDPRFGTINDLVELRKKMSAKKMFLMLDIVLNHTSQRHEWARKALDGDAYYQDFFYMYADRNVPSQFEQTMPDIFPESAPGSFTYYPEMNKWVMTVFHNYQWDLNYTNPDVFLAMLENIYFFANVGVDVLRIDAPAFIWKEMGTTCQNLPKAHTLLRLIKQCVFIATPGMALLGEAIVAPKEIMQYFGTGLYKAQECDFAYNATQMAVLWDALASSDTRVLYAAQSEIGNKPYGTSWINYTRCHDDIGLGYDDHMIEQAGFNPFAHRSFIKNFYSGKFYDSFAAGALFAFNPKTNDARISGSLASLCGLEKAIEANNKYAIDMAIKRIIMMQAHIIFLGGLPMLYYGDEAGYINDYSYLSDTGKSYDNRWMHRPVIDWEKNAKVQEDGTVEHRVFSNTKKLLSLRASLEMVADHSNIQWLKPHNIHITGYIRSVGRKRLFCIFNFSKQHTLLSWMSLKEIERSSAKLHDLWNDEKFDLRDDTAYLEMPPYAFRLMEEVID